LGQLLEVLVKKVEDLHCQNSVEETVHVALVEQGILQRKVDMQMCSIDNFRDLSHIRDEEHTRLCHKYVLIEKAWRFTLLKLDG
jgi:hypothetical protein